MLNHGLTSRSNHPDLVASTRSLLEYFEYVIENVPGSPLIRPITLCGEMFGLRVMRHRLFESSYALQQPPHPKHNPKGAIRKQGDGGYYYRVYGHETGKASWGAAMGIDWMKSPELAQAIPPAYTEWIGRQILTSIKQPD
jgi:DNA (cytosine-5)-methyltransferase 1